MGSIQAPDLRPWQGGRASFVTGEVTMNAPAIERRSPSHTGTSGAEYDACIVERALKVQRSASTVSAVEYLKNRGVDAAVICRVLTSSGRRIAG